MLKIVNLGSLLLIFLTLCFFLLSVNKEDKGSREPASRIQQNLPYVP